MPTLRDLMRNLQELEYRRSIWEMLEAHLRTFLSEKGGDEPEKVHSEAGKVPEGWIIEVIQEITKEKTGPLEQEIVDLERVEIHGEAKEEQSKSDGGQKGAAKESGGGGKKASPRSPRSNGIGKGGRLQLRNRKKGAGASG